MFQTLPHRSEIASGPSTAPAAAFFALVALALLAIAPAALAQDGAQETPAAATEAEAATDGQEPETSSQAAPPAPPTCEAPEHAAFDFWVGEWDVYRWRDEWDLAAWRADNPEATPAVNRITRRHDGCAIHEDYTTPGAYNGSSLNFFDRRDGLWHQTWIDSTGNALYLSGGLEGASMVLSDAPDEPTPAGEGRAYSRITWTPQPDGSVRQTWEQSRDGAEWQAVFDGRYVRRGGSE